MTFKKDSFQLWVVSRINNLQAMNIYEKKKKQTERVA